MTPYTRAWLESGLEQAGGKLPAHDAAGRKIDPKMANECEALGWIEPWRPNPIDPNRHPWKLTQAGRDAVGAAD